MEISKNIQRVREMKKIAWIIKLCSFLEILLLFRFSLKTIYVIRLQSNQHEVNFVEDIKERNILQNNSNYIFFVLDVEKETQYRVINARNESKILQRVADSMTQNKLE